MEARHFPDRNPLNNRLENLSWATPKQNQQDRITHKTDLRGKDHPMVKITEDVVREIRSRYAVGGIMQKELAKIYGITQSNVSVIVLRRTWKHLA